MALIKTLKETPQDFTTLWVEYGGEIGTDGYATIVLWLKIDINNTQNARFRILAKPTTGGAEYVLPINIATATVVNVEDEYHEIVADEDARRILSFILDKVVPFVQVQIQAGATGATSGQVLDSKYTLA